MNYNEIMFFSFFSVLCAENRVGVPNWIRLEMLVLLFGASV